ncbi:MAG TPA: LpxD N-terminal domain-containing protein, partial [Pyrinomonadaceae bacterium]|nr:LpxD N-terminal domain-containing protein [Pyrinomonadaceae bacterium]
MKLSELAQKTDSAIEQGSPDMEISGAAGLDIAGPKDISFLANPKYTPQIASTKAGALFLNTGVSTERTDIAILRAKDSYVAYTLALREFYPAGSAIAGIHPTAVIDASAEVSPQAEIGANVV